METAKSRNFLHIHSTFSIGDSAQSPEDIVRRVKELGGENVTLTDHRTLLGVDDFLAAGKKHGVNAIPGVEAEVLLPAKYARRFAQGDEKREEALRNVRNHLVLVPFDYEGFQAISRAMRDANTNIRTVGGTDYPCLTDEMLIKHFKGNTHVFATTACIQGPAGYLLNMDYRIRDRAQKWQAAADATKASYEAYETADELEAEVKLRLKELGKQITAAAKPLKKPFQARIANWKKKLETAEPGSKAHTKASMEVSLLLSQAEEARREVSVLEEKKAALTAKKDSYAETKEAEKKTHARHERAQRELSALYSFLSGKEALYEAAKERLMELKDIFPHFYAEMQYHGLGAEENAMPKLCRIADEMGIPLIAANDAHITDASERCVEARRLIRFNFFNKAEKTSDADREMYLKSDGELLAALSAILPEERAREAIGNLSVLEQCHVVFPEESHYPKQKEGGKPFLEVLKEARRDRIQRGIWTREYEERLKHEIRVIQKMGYVDYHMVVEHFCRIGRLMGRVPEERRPEILSHFPDLEEWIKAEGFGYGVGIGPGRGSAAGSLVCYLLGITNIDPIKYSLLFERFLNPERVSMPDIDTDVAAGVRPYLIAYLRWYYGEGAVCSIATVTTYGAKSAVKLAGRDRADQLYHDDKTGQKSRYLHEVTYAVSDLVPETPGITLADCEDAILPQIRDDKEKLLIWERAKLVENCVSGTGVHAGGVIISDNDNVNDYVPLAWNTEKQVWVAQCDMVRAEEKGLLKMDLLGLNNLDIENTCIHLVRRHHGISINTDTIPFEGEVFEKIYASGDTNGVFQVESDGMKQMLREFQPSSFEDIILMVAAYRPGPMQYLPDVIAVKNGKKKASCRHPMLEPILSTTYGAVIYQEQVMQIFQKLAGYSLGGADLVRRAMSKKKMDKLAREREAFVHGDEGRGIDGCVKRGVPEGTANKIFDELMEFAKYAFNKSHAAAYALVSYQTAWLKCHYPAEFLCALFLCKKQESYGPVFADCSMHGIKVLPPDISVSAYPFTIENGSIRYGSAGIRGVGEANRAFLENARREAQENGVYTSLTDFILRACPENENGQKVIPAKLVSTLIDAGAFDSTGYARKALLDQLSRIQDLDVPAGKTLSEAVRELPVSREAPDERYNFSRETELLGTVLSRDLLAGYGDDAAYGCTPVRDLADDAGRVSVFGYIVDGETKQTKNGKDLLRLTLQGRSGECSILFMGRSWQMYAGTWKNYLNRVVRVTGRSRDRALFAERMERLSPGCERFYLDLPDMESQRLATDTAELHREKAPEDDAELTVLLHFYKSGKRLPSPSTVKLYCTKEVVRDMQRKGLAVSRA